MDDVPLPRWLSECGPGMDVVLATRCRLARNLAGLPFPWRATELQRRMVADAVLDAAARCGGDLARAQVLRGEVVAPEQMARLQELRYASPDWARGGAHRYLLVVPDGSASVLVNEEDHLRIQAIYPGLQVESSLEHAQRIADSLSSSLEFAHHARFGFLAASPHNAGAGMRLSVMLHLAGLAAEGRLRDALQAARQVGCAVRGLYGEGSRGTGCFFQVSYIRGMGLSARQSAGRVAAAATYLIGAEVRARGRMFADREAARGVRDAAEEAVSRLWSEEAPPAELLDHLSVIRLAVCQRWMPGTLAQASEWVALAGVGAARQGPGDPAAERYEAVARTAAIRQRLRAVLGQAGTQRLSPAD